MDEASGTKKRALSKATEVTVKKNSQGLFDDVLQIHLCTTKQLDQSKYEEDWHESQQKGSAGEEYSADKDKHCPTGQIRKFNEEKRLKAEILAQRDKATTNFIRNTLDHSLEEVNLDSIGPMGSKGVTNPPSKVKTKESYEEIEILQKIVVRENLLAELHQLLRSQNDVTACLTEVVELVKAIRFQTLDIIEDIAAWQKGRPPAGFQYKGFNYLVKIKSDLDFLDYYEEIVERFCFEFTSNPLAYRGGGNVITGYGYDGHSKQRSYSQGLLRTYYTETDDEFLDGLEVSRLLNAEKVIQAEFDRIAKEKLSGREQPFSQHRHQHQGGNTGFSAENPLNRELFADMAHAASDQQKKDNQHSPTETMQPGARAKRKVKKGEKKSGSGVSLNPKKVKQERINALTEEAAELKAMLVNVDEKLRFLTDHHHDLLNQRAVLEGRMKEAKALAKEVAAQHLAAELSVNAAVVTDNAAKMKDLQRESYFINLERKRKLGTAHKLREELEEDKRRAALQKKIEAKIKKEGLLAALQSFSAKEVAALGEKAIAPARPTSAGGALRPTSSGGVGRGSPKSAGKKHREGETKGLNNSASAPTVPAVQSYWTQGPNAAAEGLQEFPALVECEEEEEGDDGGESSRKGLSFVRRAVQNKIAPLEDLVSPQPGAARDPLSPALMASTVTAEAESGAFPLGADASAALAAQRRYDLLYGQDEEGLPAEEYDVSHDADDNDGEEDEEEEGDDREGEDEGEQIEEGEGYEGGTEEAGKDERAGDTITRDVTPALLLPPKEAAGRQRDSSKVETPPLTLSEPCTPSSCEPDSPQPKQGKVSYGNLVLMNSPSDASLDGSKLSPLNYSYNSTAELDGPSSPQRRDRASRYAATNELYISDDEESHATPTGGGRGGDRGDGREGNGEGGRERHHSHGFESGVSPSASLAHTTSSPFASVIDSPEQATRSAKTPASGTLSAAGASPSPLSLSSPTGYPYNADAHSFVDFVSPDSTGSSVPYSGHPSHHFGSGSGREPAVRNPTRQLFTEYDRSDAANGSDATADGAAGGVIGVQGEVLYPAGGAYAVVRSLKLSPRPNCP